MDETSAKNRPVVLEIILLCARNELSPDKIKRLKELCQEQTEWQTIFETALRHRVFPLVYKNIRKYCSEFIPQEIQDRGKQICASNGIKNLLMTGYLSRILSLLKKQNIPAIPFKGPVLAIELYGDSGLRSFCDIDILIQQKDLPRTIKVLAILDFHPVFPLNDQQLKKLSVTDNEYPLQQKENSISLDLQWELSGGYFPSPITFETLFEQSKTLQIAGRETTVFSDEDLLFYLCVHGNQHTWKQLDHVCCVAGLLAKHPDINLNTVLLTASKHKGKRMLLIGLLLAQKLLGATIPDTFSKHLQKDLRAVELAQQISATLLTGKPASANPVSHRFMKYHLFSMDHPLLAIRYALRLIFIPTRYDWQQYPFPAYCSFLHYLIRPFRLAWNVIKGD
jgi:hypothetical protein